MAKTNWSPGQRSSSGLTTRQNKPAAAKDARRPTAQRTLYEQRKSSVMPAARNQEVTVRRPLARRLPRRRNGKRRAERLSRVEPQAAKQADRKAGRWDNDIAVSLA